MEICGILMREIQLDALKKSTCNMSWKITVLTILPHLSEANELNLGAMQPTTTPHLPLMHSFWSYS